MIDDILRDGAWKPFEAEQERRHMTRAVALGVAVALSFAGVSRGAAHGLARSRTPTRPSLHRSLDAVASAHHGVLGYTVWNLDTGERLSLRGDETFPTASLIKVPILVTLYDLADKKQLSLDDPLTVLKIDQVPGSGVLQFMHPGMSLSVHDAASLMIVLSDNTATNLLLDRIAIRRVWTKMEALGLPHTKVHSKTFLRLTSVAMDSSVKYGLGVSTPNEMAHLFALLARRKGREPGGGFGDARHPAQQRRRRLDAAHDRRNERPAQDRRDRFGANRVRAVPASVARRRVRIHETECRHPLGRGQRGAGRAREDRGARRRRVAERKPRSSLGGRTRRVAKCPVLGLRRPCCLDATVCHPQPPESPFQPAQIRIELARLMPPLLARDHHVARRPFLFISLLVGLATTPGRCPGRR